MNTRTQFLGLLAPIHATLAALALVAACSGGSTTPSSTAKDAAADSDGSRTYAPPTGGDDDAAAPTPEPSTIACDLAPFSAGAKDFVRAPTAEEFTRFVKVYTKGEVYNNSTKTSEQGTAEFKASGELVMLGKSYTPTSICFDTTVGDETLGNTLYVYFSGGKADLWEKASSYAGSLDK